MRSMKKMRNVEKRTNSRQVLGHVDTEKIAATFAIHENENFHAIFVLMFDNFIAQKVPFSFSFNLYNKYESVCRITYATRNKISYQLELLFNAFSSLTNFVDYNEQVAFVEQVLSEFLNIVWKCCRKHHRLQFLQFTLLLFTFLSL